MAAEELDALLPSRETGRRTRLLGILNLTPDSFHDGGLDAGVEDSAARARALVAAGADALDLGAESSRPGAEPVSAAEELDRLLPVLEHARDLGVPVSVDTVKADVAAQALAAGATLVNDISALAADPRMAAVCAEAGCPVVLMHMRGTPRTMKSRAHYDDVVDEVRSELAERMEYAVRAGIRESRLILDPGIGFAKTAAQSLELIRRMPEFRSLGRPLLVGASRKSFLAEFSGQETADRLPGTLAVTAASVAAGVEILRVHDVAENLAVIRTMEALLGTPGPVPATERTC